MRRKHAASIRAGIHAARRLRPWAQRMWFESLRGDDLAIRAYRRTRARLESTGEGQSDG